MAIILFILGRPGCGKSAALRKISRLAQHRGWQTDAIIDYRILKAMFQKEQKRLVSGKRKFRPSKYGGFDVVDFAVLDDALREVEKTACNLITASQSSKQKLILIEFARDDYEKALHLFHQKFLQNAYFLFIHADIDTCIERVNERVARHDTEDDHFVSERIIRNYYGKDITPAIISDIESTFCLDHQKVKFVDSNGTWDQFLYEVRAFTYHILDTSSSTSRNTGPLANAFSSNGRHGNNNLVEVV